MSYDDFYRTIREALERSRPTEEQIRAIRAYQEQLDKLASGLPAREYLEEMNRAIERQKALLPYHDFEETRRALEKAIKPLPEIDFLSLRRAYGEDITALEASIRGISASIAGANFLGEIELGPSEEEEPAQEEAKETTQEEVEEQLVEIVPADVLSEFKKVEFVPLRLLDQILRSPELMRDLSPRDFERFVATLIDEIGFENVVITPRSNDQGRDILAVKRVHGIPVLFAFECKRYGVDKPIGIELLRALFGTISHGPTKANKGVLVTTSRFTSGARRFLLTEPSLDGKDFNGIVGWLGEYAKQTQRGVT
jgi:hypothetical protein